MRNAASYFKGEGVVRKVLPSNCSSRRPFHIGAFQGHLLVPRGQNPRLDTDHTEAHRILKRNLADLIIASPDFLGNASPSAGLSAFFHGQVSL
jgi:hypothetical protein